MRLTLESTVAEPTRWAVIAARIAAWADEHGVALRDAIVLLPFAQLLPEARAAFTQRGGWMPRIETTRTLAASLGPAAPLRVGELSFDPTLDALSASALLCSRPWGAAWARRDARGFEQAVHDLVLGAQVLLQAAAALPPRARAA
ncbi:MAG TPA: hypothetical protein VNU48_10240, partial [Burkholderiaceae bacterium]|nr:hypothetical protein [Burkholderiaceae bacterium]